MEIGLELLLIFFVTGLLAGLVDSIAGGGGLLTVPVLLWSGLPPALALGTNKLQGSIGTLASSFHFYRHGHIPLKGMLWPIVLTFTGSAAGTLTVQNIQAEYLATLLPILILLFAMYFMFSPRISDKDAHQRLSMNAFGFIGGFGVGFYDGFFGPGAGAFYMVAFVALMGFNLVKATAHTKLLNFTSNISSLLFFQLAGLVSWPVGLAMGAGQLIGSSIGAHLSIRHGSRLIKPLLVIVSVLISAKLLWERF